MIDGRSILALIPARGGSKRLPGKNVKLLGGKPLIAWSIEFARGLHGIDEMLVSTDDERIAQVSREAGASVPWLRPAQFATDTSPSSEAILHALDALEASGRRFDLLLLLQPTSPFRRAKDVLEAIRLCIAGGGDPVVGFAPAKSNPAWVFKVDAQGRTEPFCGEALTSVRSQDLPPAYEISGALYVCSVDYYRRTKTFFGPETRALVIEERELAVDVDDAFDWMVAEAVAARGWPA